MDGLSITLGVSVTEIPCSMRIDRPPHFSSQRIRYIQQLREKTALDAQYRSIIRQNIANQHRSASEVEARRVRTKMLLFNQGLSSVPSPPQRIVKAD